MQKNSLLLTRTKHCMLCTLPHPDPHSRFKNDGNPQVSTGPLLPLQAWGIVSTGVLQAIGLSKQRIVAIHLQDSIAFVKLPTLLQTKRVTNFTLWEGVRGGDKSRVVWCTRPVGEEEVEGLGGLGWVVVEVDCHTAELVALWCPEWTIRNHSIAYLQHSLSICSHCPLRYMELDNVFISFLVVTLRLQREYPSIWSDKKGFYPWRNPADI